MRERWIEITHTPKLRGVFISRSVLCRVGGSCGATASVVHQSPYHTWCTCTAYVNGTAEEKIPLVQCLVPQKLYVCTYIRMCHVLILSSLQHMQSRPMHCNLLIMIFSVTFPIKLNFCSMPYYYITTDQFC